MPQTSYNMEPVQAESTDNSNKNSRKPDNTAFKQQKLPAWQPILTPKSVLPTFFIVAVIFIPIGAVLLITSDGVVEAFQDYTECFSLEDPELKCSSFRSANSFMNETCTCRVNITVDKQMNGQVFAYYGLTGFFQNHRRYVKSRDDIQLVGEDVSNSISSDCQPYDKRTVRGVEMPIAPCGAIANSLFNDSFELFTPTGGPVSLIRTGIAWHTDHTTKFQNPQPRENLTAAFLPYAQPLYWQQSVIDLDPKDISNNGYKNEAFEVWMRTAAFPTFRKLYGRLNVTLDPGVYFFNVSYNYPVTAFGGTKRFILSTSSFMGGKNSFLGIAYIVVGVVSFVVAIALSFTHSLTKNRSQ